ncbi:baseplate J/gp47 family protein [Pseudovibrio axinellae]|nr:baseplate J/gp47 family protein [Pseudovibrio axinellae]
MSDNTLLPPELITDTSFETIADRLIQNVMTDFSAHDVSYTTLNIQADPLRRVLETFATELINTRHHINDEWVSHFVMYSQGVPLDKLADFYGVARMTGEEDTRFRERLLLHIAGRSGGGPEERYKALAMDAHIDVMDVAIWDDGIDPTLNVGVLSTVPGGIAGPELLVAVYSHLILPDNRVTSDRFNVVSAVTKIVDVALIVQLEEYARDTAPIELEEKLRAAWEVEDRLGLDLTRAWLVSTAMRDGINNVIVEAPFADVIADPNEAIALGSISITSMGRGR